MSITHIHVHSDYSTLDGAGKIKDLVARAVELGQHSIACSDHGSMSGVYDLYNECNKAGIKPIIGCEFYIESPSDGKNNHIIVLAKNETGVENMYKLTEFANFSNFYRKPRITYRELFEKKEGLVVTSACLGGTIPRYIMSGDIVTAYEVAREMQRQFGDDFYLEIQPNNIPEQHSLNISLVAMSEQLNIPLVLANDVHYTRKEDAFAHEVLLAMQMHKKMDDEKRFKFPSNDFWLKSEEEMRDGVSYLNKKVVDKAIENTNIIADKCNVTFSYKSHLPKYCSIPEGMTSRQLLAERINEGVKKLDYSKHASDLQEELNVIDRNGYSDYFLIVQDYINSAKKRGELVSPGRGSAAGSKVAYTTGISVVDPAKYNLLFERFLSDGRVPDYCIVA